MESLLTRGGHLRAAVPAHPGPAAAPNWLTTPPAGRLGAAQVNRRFPAAGLAAMCVDTRLHPELGDLPAELGEACRSGRIRGGPANESGRGESPRPGPAAGFADAVRTALGRARRRRGGGQVGGRLRPGPECNRVTGGAGAGRRDRTRTPSDGDRWSGSSSEAWRRTLGGCTFTLATGQRSWTCTAAAHPAAWGRPAGLYSDPRAQQPPLPRLAILAQVL